MSLLAAIRKLWRSVAPRTHSDVEEEFRSTLDAYQEDLILQGFPEKEARRKARVALGRGAAQNETYRDAIGLRLFDEFSGDLSYGLGALRRNPGFTAVAVLSLALGLRQTLSRGNQNIDRVRRICSQRDHREAHGEETADEVESLHVQRFLDVRVHVLNGTLKDAFRQWYRGFRPNKVNRLAHFFMVSNMSSFPLQPALKVRKIRFKGSVTSGLRLCGE